MVCGVGGYRANFVRRKGIVLVHSAGEDEPLGSRGFFRGADPWRFFDLRSCALRKSAALGTERRSRIELLGASRKNNVR